MNYEGCVMDDDESLPGEPVSTDWGPHWRVRQPIDAVWPDSSRYLSRITEPTSAEPVSYKPDKFAADLVALRTSFPHRAVYLDLETCGFAGTMVFLIGLIHWQNDRLTLTQLWARNYAEEKAILQSLWTIVAVNDVLVTFNGKSFDWPSH